MTFHPHRRLTRSKHDLDPVCGMPVGADAPGTRFMGFEFRFCSEQCRERFEAHPHLYVGRPGIPAPRQRGEEVHKRRAFKLAAVPDPEQARAIRHAVSQLMGIHECQVEGSTVWVSYDLLQSTARQIEAAIAGAGAPLSDSLSARLGRALLHYLEETELANREHDLDGGGHHHH